MIFPFPSSHQKCLFVCFFLCFFVSKNLQKSAAKKDGCFLQKKMRGILRIQVKALNE